MTTWKQWAEKFESLAREANEKHAAYLANPKTHEDARPAPKSWEEWAEQQLDRLSAEAASVGA